MNAKVTAGKGALPFLVGIMVTLVMGIGALVGYTVAGGFKDQPCKEAYLSAKQIIQLQSDSLKASSEGMRYILSSDAGGVQNSIGQINTNTAAIANLMPSYTSSGSSCN